MILHFRQSLLILLALLQLIAPLVHAHAQDHSPHFGLHLPSLEVYDSDTNSAAIHTPQDFALDSAIVSIAPGIKNPKQHPDSSSKLFFLPGLLIVFCCLQFYRKIYFLPSTPPAWQSLLTSPQAPRAPPVKTI